MNAFLVIVRAAYALATIVLFGELVFRWWVERAAMRRLPEVETEAWLASRQRIAILAAALGVAFVSSVLWYLAQVQVMSGTPFDELSRDTLRSALVDTEFGRVSLVRFGLALAFAIALALLQKENRRRAMTIAACAIAVGLLSSIAWTGHANGEQGESRLVHLSSDVMHLLAAGAWLGALPALVSILFNARRDASAPALELAALATKRFSILGIAAVSTLVFTGIVNSWFTVGSPPALLGTNYGQLLSFKLLLFAAMLALAATNRLRYTPQILQSAGSAGKVSGHSALARLGLNAQGEIALGIAVVCIVGGLGIATPGAHVQTVWPFRYTFHLDSAREHGLAAFACLGAFAASIILASTLLRRRRLEVAAAVAIAMIALCFLLLLLAVPANPGTYFRSPVGYSADSIASGARLYAAQCSNCHGPQGHGDGAAAAALAQRPVDLTTHVLHQHEGDVYWLISRGIPGKSMPAFEGRLRESDIWNVVNWLRAHAESEAAKPMADKVQSWAIEAPDFTFQIDHGRQESLADQRGHSNVLLVLFDPVESQARLRALSKFQSELHHAGLRVIAIPTRAEGPSAADLQMIGGQIVASFDQRVVLAYGIFAPMDSVPDEQAGPGDAEFLIDRHGYIRARWDPKHGSERLQAPYLLSLLPALDRGTPQPLGGHSDHHAH